ncbi:FKBP-type peptidyl-prolyl cis-trans isomerase [Microbacterium sp. SLBN-146]|uniref:FKBP-type peptidyl-prolyl cis-trans isomerase n=1 Tax=Microbacterium sp. SLBN-146 TaxID=2768457 RepID=UPI0011541F0E|nr:hypothetical protein [Microbacterium sp. SLBN-146]TQJ32250.1 peptidylprolyl isomerase [Microbacterium sp. SLBN-146]
MRKVPVIPGAVAVLGLVAVGLVGCSQSSEADCRPVADDAKLTELVSVTGDVGQQPEIDVYTPFHVDESVSARVIDGEGTPVTTDGQVVMLDFSIVSGETGEVVYESGYSGASTPSALAGLTGVIPALTDPLRCATADSRTIIGVAPGGIVAEAAVNLGLAEDDSAVVVVDIQKVYLPHAEGSLVFNAGGGLPSVVRAPDGRPGVTIPDSPAPADDASQTLIRGNGAEVTAEDSIRVHYTTLDWDTKEVLESSWDAEPVALGLATVQESLADALIGQTVGSQVLVVQPAVEASADAAAQAARVFVIDILGIDPVAQ